MTTLRTTVMMKTDIQGSTVRFRALPEADLNVLPSEHRTFVSRLAEAHDGRIVKPEKDGFWVVFPSVTAGVLAAMHMQEELRLAQPGKGDDCLAMRIVLTLGDVLHQEGALMGDAVVLAARIEEITPPDEIYLSPAAWLAVNQAEVQTSFVDAFVLKGFPEPVPVYRIVPTNRMRVIADQYIVFTDNEQNEPADLQKHREEWLSQTRREWYRVMRPLGSWVPWDLADQLELNDIEVEDYFRPAPRLDGRHVRHCRVVPDRVDLLKTCLPKHGVVAELGTDHGDFAEMILRFSLPKEFHIIDITLAQFRREVFASAIDQGTVRLHESDSVEALRRFSDGYFDWIYIDANHSDAGVKRDIDEAKKKVKRNGLLVFNDYIFWSHREFMSYGVVQAVNEFCLAEDWELLYLALHPEMYGDVVLRKI